MHQSRLIHLILLQRLNWQLRADGGYRWADDLLYTRSYSSYSRRTRWPPHVVSMPRRCRLCCSTCSPMLSASLCWFPMFPNNGRLPPSNWSPKSKIQPHYDISDQYLSSQLSSVSVYKNSSIPPSPLHHWMSSSILIDQFAFWPSASTTAAVIFILHHTIELLKTNTNVTLISLDFFKAFPRLHPPFYLDCQAR